MPRQVVVVRLNTATSVVLEQRKLRVGLDLINQLLNGLRYLLCSVILGVQVYDQNGHVHRGIQLPFTMADKICGHRRTVDSYAKLESDADTFPARPYLLVSVAAYGSGVVIVERCR